MDKKTIVMSMLIVALFFSTLVVAGNASEYELKAKACEMEFSQGEKDLLYKTRTLRTLKKNMESTGKEIFVLENASKKFSKQYDEVKSSAQKGLEDLLK